MGLLEICYGVLLALLPVYLAQYLQIGIKYVGFIIAIFSFAELICKTPGGWLADKIGRKPVLLTGIGLITLSFFLLTIIKKTVFLLPVVALSGAGMSVTWPMIVAIISETIEEEHRASSMGTLGMVCLLGKGIGPALGSLAILLTGIYQGAFYLNALLACLSFALIYFLVEDTLSWQARKKKKDSPFIALLRLLAENKTLLVLNGLLLAQALGFGILVPTITLYATKVLGVKAQVLGSFLLIPVLFMAALTYITGKLADKIGKTRPIKIGITILSISMLILPFSTNWVYLFSLIIIFGFGYALLMPSWTALVTEEAPDSQRGIVLGSVGTMQGLGFTIGPLLGTYIWESWGWAAAFYLCGCILGLGAILAFWGIRGKV